jgi:hypothetical protein
LSVAAVIAIAKKVPEKWLNFWNAFLTHKINKNLDFFVLHFE